MLQLSTMVEPTSCKKTTYDDKLPYIPPEICTEIIARLPAKSLIKFRCVCKTWCSLIDSSDFILMHLKTYNNNRNKSYLLASKCSETTLHSIDPFKKIDVFFETPEKYIVLRSCHGLYLMDRYDYSLSTSIVLHNPCIRKSLVIPACPFIEIGRYRSIGYWLGFAPSSNDYKVVAFGYDMFPMFSIAVYSLNDHVWRVKDRLDVHIRGFLSYNEVDGCVVYLKGAMYWLGFDEDKSGPAGTVCELQTLLVSFDFDSEEFVFVDLPQAAIQSTIKFNFVFGESIAVFGMSSKRTSIWVLVKDGVEKSWNLWYTGDSNLYALEFLESSTFTKIFNVGKNTFFVQNNGGLYSYNFKSHEMQCLYHHTDGHKSFETYAESLVLHKRNQGEILTTCPRDINIEYRLISDDL